MKRRWTDLPSLAATLLALLLTACGATGPSLDPDEAEDELLLSSTDGPRYGSYLSYEHVVRAELERARGDLKAAAAALREALVNDPDDFYLRVMLAEVLTELGEHEAARRQIRRAIAGEPTAELAWIALAELYLAEGEPEQAEEAARRAIRVEPRRHDAALWLAAHLREHGEQQRAAEIYRKIVAAAPDNAAAHRGLGEVSLALGQLEAARDHLAAYLDLDRTDPEVVAALARAYLEGGETGRAIGLLELAVALESADSGLRERLIALLVEQGLHRRAVRHLRSLPRLTSADRDAAVRRACWLAKAGRPYLARRLIVDVHGPAPADVELRLALAAIELGLGRLELADKLLDTAGDDLNSAQRARRRALRDARERWPDAPVSCAVGKP
jgi:tetratricopeptide (TPR) repeat protein